MRARTALEIIDEYDEVILQVELKDDVARAQNSFF
jgi:hypothetical protein